MKINSFVYEMMIKADQQQLAVDYGLQPFEVFALNPERTLCEKIMSLVRFSYSDDPIEDLKKKIRHTYDLYQMLNKKEISEFFQSKDFDQMMVKVASDDFLSFKNNNLWLKPHPVEAKIFAETETVWNELRSIYQGEFKNLVFGDFPDESTIFETLIMIKNRLSRVGWDVNF